MFPCAKKAKLTFLQIFETFRSKPWYLSIKMRKIFDLICGQKTTMAQKVSQDARQKRKHTEKSRFRICSDSERQKLKNVG